MSEIVTVAQSSSNAIRSHSFPTLESGNVSFPEGRYVVNLIGREDCCSFTINHRVEGAPLVDQLLAERKAIYVCVVSSPLSSYRQTHQSMSASHVVGWDNNDLGESPLLTPMVVCRQAFRMTLDTDRHGVHPIWSNRVVEFDKGNRLAVSHVIQLQASIFHLLSFRADNEIPEGAFRVEPEFENGFRFRVSLSPQLHSRLRFPSQDSMRDHVMTHIVSASFSLLRHEFGAAESPLGNWENHRSLRGLADFLRSQGLPVWDEDGFSPEMAATSIYPHPFTPQTAEGDRDG